MLCSASPEGVLLFEHLDMAKAACGDMANRQKLAAASANAYLKIVFIFIRQFSSKIHPYFGHIG
jgi:hypothetical protein